MSDASQEAALRRGVAVGGVAFVVIVAIGFVPYERHPYMAFEQIPAFSAIFAVVCSVALAMVADQLRPWLTRDASFDASHDHGGKE